MAMYMFQFYSLKSSQRDRQISYIDAYIYESGKMVKMVLFVGQQRRHRHREWTSGPREGRIASIF